MAGDDSRFDDGADETWVSSLGGMGVKFWIGFASGFSLLRGVFVVIALLALKWVDLLEIKTPTDASLVVLGVVISFLLTVDFSFLSITNYFCLKASKRHADRVVRELADTAGVSSVVSGANAGSAAMIGVNAIAGALERIGVRVERVNGVVTQLTFPPVSTPAGDSESAPPAHTQTQALARQPAKVQPYYPG